MPSLPELLEFIGRRPRQAASKKSKMPVQTIFHHNSSRQGQRAPSSFPAISPIAPQAGKTRERNDSEINHCSDFSQQRNNSENLYSDYSQQQNNSESNRCSDYSQTNFFAMIPKLFSEGVRLQNNGPRSAQRYKSSARLLDGGKSYCSRVELVQRLVPVNYVTQLLVDGEVVHRQRVDFARRTVPGSFSETVNCFPRERVHVCRSEFVYEESSKERRYVQKLELAPVQKVSMSLKLAAVPNHVQHEE